jgi:hypothetical protein
MLMVLPNNLRLPRSFRSQNAVFINVNIHTAVICLHREALSKMRQLSLPEHSMLQSQARLLPAAEEILNIFRMITELDAALKNPLMAFSAYMAALVFLQDFMTDHNHQSEDNLDLLLRIMIAVSKTNAVARSLANQLAMDMRQSGISSSSITEKVRRTTTTTTTTTLCSFSFRFPFLPQHVVLISPADQGATDDLRTRSATSPARPQHFQCVVLFRTDAFKSTTDCRRTAVKLGTVRWFWCKLDGSQRRYPALPDSKSWRRRRRVWVVWASRTADSATTEPAVSVR